MTLLPALLSVALGVTPVTQAHPTLLEVPADRWEFRSDGINVAMVLVAASGHTYINIYLKNTSGTEKLLIIDSNDTGFQLEVETDKGQWKPLKSYDSSDISMAAPVKLEPGQTKSHRIEISPQELALIKNRSIKCRIAVFDPATKQHTNVETTPKKITQP